MEKFELIKTLDDMEKYHRIQYKKVKNMLNGVETTNPTPLKSLECTLGKWLYDEQKLLKNVLGENFYLRLKTMHNEWHEYYEIIFNCYYKMTKKSIFSKEKLQFNKNLTSDEEVKVKDTYAKLEHTSTNLFKHFDICRKRMYALPQNSYN